MPSLPFVEKWGLTQAYKSTETGNSGNTEGMQLRSLLILKEKKKKKKENDYKCRPLRKEDFTIYSKPDPTTRQVGGEHQADPTQETQAPACSSCIDLNQYLKAIRMGYLACSKTWCEIHKHHELWVRP